jgi:tRNA dimethylallyltransferase
VGRRPHKILFARVTSSQSLSKPIIAVVGPTASGKSSLGIETALRLNGEIINCDSVQVYQGIEIATAKVPVHERQGVPHHLIDFVPPEVNYTAGQWAKSALEKIQEIEERNRTAMLVGGTGFYLRALRNPFFPGPLTDDRLRRRLTKLREDRGPEHLHRLLQRLDPEAARRFFPRDWPRVQRAIEVRLQTGQRLSDQLPHRAVPHEAAGRIRIIALNPPRAALYDRINLRAQQHFDAGLVAEARGLLNQGIPAESNALGAHGYRRAVEFLHGKRSLESAIEQTKQDVRNYAKRQMTWFRREVGVYWFDGFGDDPFVQQRIFEYLNIK